VPGARSTTFGVMRAAASGSISEGAIAGSCALVLYMLWGRKSRSEEDADASRRFGSLAVRLQYAKAGVELSQFNQSQCLAVLAGPSHF
jgi:hypothetical protein